eukprot:CAMPEP_0184695476 /NCGR_PEP_ID=MMETSP0313-20130426/3088_1 /TAXON_ID=2792 /ORGANISM="Porphyridium aerugineum, Strain SAG 1380-2" /LENGTH=381 /DNA_ID=CAMNT_0027153935 /DNA_START=44 /DNA_END=1186 /DNA_ORIENTATION=-
MAASLSTSKTVHLHTLLHPDCLQLIFQKLDLLSLLTAGSVCREWHRVVIQLMQNVKAIDLGQVSKQSRWRLQEYQILSMLSMFCNLESITLKGWSDHHVDIAKIVLQKYKSEKLNRIDLRGRDGEFDINDIRAFAKNCPNLQHINISSCSTITDVMIEQLMSLWKQSLCSVDVSNCKKVTSKSIRMMVLRGISTIIASSCPKICGPMVVPSSNNCKIELLKLNSTNLTALHIAGDVLIQSLYLTDCKYLENLIIDAKTLVTLNMTGCKRLADAIITGEELTEVNFFGCYRISTEVIENVCVNCKKLRILNCNGAYSGTSFHVNMPSLETCDFVGCNSLDAFSMEAPNLKSVSFSNKAPLSQVHIKMPYGAQVKGMRPNFVC